MHSLDSPTGRLGDVNRSIRGCTLVDIESLGSLSHPLDLGWVSTDDSSVLSYLRAVGDELPVYQESRLVPPLYVVALALGQILQRASLPSGAIHSLQEFDLLGPIPLGCEVRAKAWLERHRVRGDLRFMTFGVSAEDAEGGPAMATRTTLLVAESQGQQEKAVPVEAPHESRIESTETVKSDLPSLRREITRSQLVEYSRVSGDLNPLHLDPEFAAGTQFGGIIAHGMLTLALVSEMLAASLRENWLSSGTLRARFKGAAYLGNCVETWGNGNRDNGDNLSYSVGLRNSATGEDLITGTATVRKN